MGTLAQALRGVPLTVRQLVALELLEAAQQAHERAVMVDSEWRYGGARDLLAQKAFAYQELARLMTEPPTAQTD